VNAGGWLIICNFSAPLQSRRTLARFGQPGSLEVDSKDAGRYRRGCLGRRGRKVLLGDLEDRCYPRIRTRRSPKDRPSIHLSARVCVEAHPWYVIEAYTAVSESNSNLLPVSQTTSYSSSSDSESHQVEINRHSLTYLLLAYQQDL
jgi:hypothetical protein